METLLDEIKRGVLAVFKANLNGIEMPKRQSFHCVHCCYFNTSDVYLLWCALPDCFME